MTTLQKRATPSQFRMLRAIAGAVDNAAHAHRLEMPKHFAHSVAKRATGTLTAQWPEVLAATAEKRRQDGSRERQISRGPRGDHCNGDHSKGGRLGLLRRSPIRALWKRFAAGMWQVKYGPPEICAAHVRILRLLDEAQRELDALSLQERCD